MNHAYYLSDSLDELEVVHDELIDCGLKDRNIHVLSEAEAEVQKHHMRPLNSILKTGMLSYMGRGAVIGGSLAVLIVGLSEVFGLGASAMSSKLMIAGSIAVFLFCIWEAGLLGLQHRSIRFESIQAALGFGEHLLILDYEPKQTCFVDRVLRNHPQLFSVTV